MAYEHVVIKMAIHTISFIIPDNIDQVYAQEALAAVLYYNGKLSEKEARMMIGKTRREFQEEIIPKYSLSMIGGTQEDIEIEINACQ
jgi:hypothetical protein